jgi:molecular chaperone GrpE
MNEENNKETEILDQTSEEVVENFQEKYLYLLADFQNYKKRMEKQQEMLVKYSLETFFQEFIEVIDNFERMTSSLEIFEDKQYKNMMLGFTMINKQFVEVLNKFGLEEISTKGTFDPHQHEAIEEVSQENTKNNEIIKCLQKGYKLHDRLLRASKVVVNKQGGSNE